MLSSRYSPATSTFTVPPGGDGLYYFSAFFKVDNGEMAQLDVTINGNRVCSAYGDLSHYVGNDYPQATCSGLAHMVEGRANLQMSLGFVIPQASSCGHVLLICPTLCLFAILGCSFFPGDEVQVLNGSSSDGTPLYGSTVSNYNGFTGFRL